MNTPNGTNLLATLLDLLADQEGVVITYELVDSTGNARKECTKQNPTVQLD